MIGSYSVTLLLGEQTNQTIMYAHHQKTIISNTFYTDDPYKKNEAQKKAANSFFFAPASLRKLEKTILLPPFARANAINLCGICIVREYRRLVKVFTVILTCTKVQLW